MGTNHAPTHTGGWLGAARTPAWGGGIVHDGALPGRRGDGRVRRPWPVRCPRGGHRRARSSEMRSFFFFCRLLPCHDAGLPPTLSAICHSQTHAGCAQTPLCGGGGGAWSERGTCPETVPTVSLGEVANRLAHIFSFFLFLFSLPSLLRANTPASRACHPPHAQADSSGASGGRARALE